MGRSRKFRKELSKEYIAAMRGYLRISSDALDAEITDLVSAARDDLILSGVHPKKAYDEKDALIKRAIGIYVKAEFGLDNADSEKYREAFTSLKERMTLSSEYTESGGG